MVRGGKGVMGGFKFESHPGQKKEIKKDSHPLHVLSKTLFFFFFFI